jgi:ferredoxin--NADP+ reductase
VIEPGSPEERLNATVVANRQLNASLFVLEVRCDGEKPAHEAGQFASLGLPARSPEHAGRDGLVKRPYSIASAPGAATFEFYVRLVEGGALTPSLQALRPGDRLWVDDKCLGKFTLTHLAEVPPAHERDLVCVATGTGLAPFLSMLREHRAARERGVGAPWNRCVLIEGVRLAEDLGYLDEIAGLAREHRWLHYLPICSREPAESSWSGPRGRVGELLRSEVFRARTGFALDPRTCQVMLCGNPQMIDEVEADLLARGFARHRKKEPGQLHIERYW